MKPLDFHLESRPCPKCGVAMLYDEGEPWDGPTWACTGCGHSENAVAQAKPAADARKPCTCDGAGRGPGRACVVKAGGRLGDLWRCADGCNGCDDCTDYEA